MTFIPDEELISAYLDDELSAEERAHAEQLLVERPDLRRLLEELRGLREGLQSLPTFALGDEFGAEVLRRAEREVLRGDSTITTDGQAPGAAAGEPPTANPSAAAQAQEERPVDLAPGESRLDRQAGPRFDPGRWRRSAVWSLTAVAAALLLMFVDRNLREGRQEVAMNQAGKPAPRAGDPTADQAEADGRRLKRNKEQENRVDDLARKAPLEGMLAHDAARGLTESKVAGDSPQRRNADGLAMKEKIGVGLDRYTVQQKDAGGRQAGSVAENEALQTGVQGKAVPGKVTAEDELELVRRNDVSRGQALAFEYLLLQSQSGNREVPAERLQRLGKLESQQPVGFGVQQQLAAGPAAGLGAGQAPTQAVDQRAYALANNDNPLVCIVDVKSPDAIDKVVMPALQREQIADWSLAENRVAGEVGAAQQRSDKQSNLGVSNYSFGAGTTTAGTLGAFAPRQAGEKNKPGEAQTQLAEQSPASAKEEFFYVVASKEQIASTLTMLQSQPQYVLNVRVEADAATPEEAQRWAAYNRDGVQSQMRREIAGGGGVPAVAGTTPIAAPAASANTAPAGGAAAASASTATSSMPAKSGGGSLFSVRNSYAENAPTPSASGGAVDGVKNGSYYNRSRAQRFNSEQVVTRGNEAFYDLSARGISLNGAANGAPSSLSPETLGDTRPGSADKKGEAFKQAGPKPTAPKTDESGPSIAKSGAAGSASAQSAAMGQPAVAAGATQVPAGSGLAKNASAPPTDASALRASQTPAMLQTAATPSSVQGQPPAAPSAPATTASAAVQLQQAAQNNLALQPTAPVQQMAPISQAAPGQQAVQGLNRQFSSASPPLPDDYREALFIFRVVGDASAAEQVPATADSETTSRRTVSSGGESTSGKPATPPTSKMAQDRAAPSPTATPPAAAKPAAPSSPPSPAIKKGG